MGSCASTKRRAIRRVHGVRNTRQNFIESNSTTGDGGGVRMLGDGASNRQMDIVRSLIRLNSATWSGDGVYFNAGTRLSPARDREPPDT
jgi:hypothetical protein